MVYLPRLTEASIDGTFSPWALFNQWCLQLATESRIARILERKLIGQRWKESLWTEENCFSLRYISDAVMNFLDSFFWRARMAQWWEHSPPTNVARIPFLPKWAQMWRLFGGGAYSNWDSTLELIFLFSCFYNSAGSIFLFFQKNKQKKANGQQMHEEIGREEVAEPWGKLTRMT